MHHIQRELLGALLLTPSIRFKDLKPAGMESNLFMYHLNALIKGGYVKKINQSYALSSEGKHFVDRADLANLRIELQPKIIVIVVVRRSDGKLILLERLHQPFIGYKGFVSGKIRYGEALQDAADRELLEKTGIKEIKLQLRGSIIMKFTRASNVVNHVVGYVFYGTLPNGVKIQRTTPHFRSYWGERQDLNTENRFKGHSELFELLEQTPSNRLFFAEFTFTADF